MIITMIMKWSLWWITYPKQVDVHTTVKLNDETRTTTGVILFVGNNHLKIRTFVLILRRQSFESRPSSLLTGRSAVAAHVIPRHPLDLSQDCLGQLLHDVVLADMLVPFKGLIQRLLLTVL